MKRTIAGLFCITMICVVAGYAESPHSDPACVSPVQYQSYKCKQIVKEMQHGSGEIDSASQEPAHDARKKIMLNLGGRASKVVLAMAAATPAARAATSEPPRRELEIGDKMPDGTIYAGVSPDTGKAMYVTPADARFIYTFDEAREYAKDLDAHGHKDWRVPTRDDLNVLFNNRVAIGGFNITGKYLGGWYWSASSVLNWGAWCQDFGDGSHIYNFADFSSSLRCVR